MINSREFQEGNPKAALEARDLRVDRGGRPILKDINLTVNPGTLLYVTGANGSGKTTLLNTLAGLVEPENGDVYWSDCSIRKSPGYRYQMAYLAHNNGMSGNLAVTDNLGYAARLAGNSEIDSTGAALTHALSCVGLEKQAGRQLRQLSQGQQRRVALARLLLQRARLWLLDEPINALDADSSERFRNILSAHLFNGGMAVVSAHQSISVDAPQVRTLQL